MENTILEIILLFVFVPRTKYMQLKNSSLWADLSSPIEPWIKYLVHFRSRRRRKMKQKQGGVEFCRIFFPSDPHRTWDISSQSLYEETIFAL